MRGAGNAYPRVTLVSRVVSAEVGEDPWVWVTLPEGMDTGKDGELFNTALAQGMLYVSGEYCFGPDPRRQTPRNQLRLTYGTVDEAAIEEGIARLAKAVRMVYAKSHLGAKAC